MAYKESETLELKRSTSELKEAIISIVTILNKHKKGEIYFGIRDNGIVIGQDVSEKTIRKVSKAISDSIEPKIFPKITESELDEKKCIHIEFSGNDFPYYAYGRAYVRVGDEDKKISAKELENIILERNRDKIRWDNQICKRAMLDDLDDDLISKFVELTKKSKRINIGNENKELILKKLELMHGSKITNAAVLLFCKEPSRFFDNTLVRCGRFKGVVKQEFIDMKDFRGNLFDNLEKSISFFQDHLRLGAKIKGLLREEKWEIPLEALREAVINSLIHRDYFDNSFVYIKIYDASIVIANPGSLPDTLKIADLYKEHESRLRNPLIAKVFYYAGFIDAWGRGILNIIELLKDNGLDKPGFEQSGGSFRIIFKRNITPLVTPPVKLTELEEKIFTEIKKNPKISRNNIAEQLGIKLDTVKEYINKLKEKGVLKRVGKTSAGYWEIK